MQVPLFLLLKCSFVVKHGRPLAADSSGLEMKHGIAHQNYRRGIRTKSIIAEVKSWTEHKIYVQTAEHEEGRTVLLGHLQLPANLSILTFAALAPSALNLREQL